MAYALAIEETNLDEEPTTYEEALASKESENWKKAMQEEMKSLLKNDTWSLVKRQGNMKVVDCKWLYKVKQPLKEGERPLHKARLVAKGFTQTHGVDYHEVFSPVVKHTSIRVMLALVAEQDMELHQMDVRTAFLHGDLEETIHMEQPKGFEVSKGRLCCLLKRPIYGLKQSSRQWYLKFNSFMLGIGFTRSREDNCIYLRRGGSNHIEVYLLLYVDDILIASQDMRIINEVKHSLKMEFEMKDLGEASKILGIEIKRDRAMGLITLSQEGYMKKLLKRFMMVECKPANTPLETHIKLSKEDCPCDEKERVEMANTPYACAVGSIMYAMISTRPDLAYAMSVLSRYMSNPGKKHWNAMKMVLRYIKGTLTFGLRYKGGSYTNSSKLIGYTDSDYAKCLDTRKSVSGYCFTLFGSVVSWKCSLQHVVALSTTEAEFMAATEAVKEALWLQGLLKELAFDPRPTHIMCDNQSAIHIMKNPSFHDRSKHIHVRMHFIRDIVEDGQVAIMKIESSSNSADLFTKPLVKMRMLNLLGAIGFGDLKHQDLDQVSKGKIC